MIFSFMTIPIPSLVKPNVSGVEWTNPDILDNYSAKGSWDLNSNDGDPMPRLDEAGLNHHGTRYVS